MKKILKSIASRLNVKRFSAVQAIVVAVIFGGLGVALLQLSRADTILDHADWTFSYPSEDAHVTNYKAPGSKSPVGTWNQGSSTQLWVNNQNGKCDTKFPDCFNYFSNQAYLKFNVKGATGKKIKSAVLRMYVVSGSPNGGSLFAAKSNNWSENSITWNNAPGLNSLVYLGNPGKVKSGQWVTFKIDLSKSPIKNDGTYSFVIASNNQDPVVYSSREGSNPPQLALVFDSPPIYNMPNSIIGAATCTSSMPDQTAAINSWIASVPNGTIARFRQNTCFRTEGSAELIGKSNVIVDGNGATLRAFTDGCVSQDPMPSSNKNPYDYCIYKGDGASVKHLWPRNRYAFDIEGNKNVAVRNLNLVGYTAADPSFVVPLEAQSAFNISNHNDGVLLDRVSAQRIRGDYVTITAAQNIIVINSTFTGGAGRQGLTITDGTNVTFNNNRIGNPARSMFDLEPNLDSEELRNVHIENNTVIGGGGNGGFFSCYGANAIFDGVYFKNNTIKGAQFTINCMPPKMPNPNDPATYRRRNFQFVNNTSDTAGSTPFGAHARIRGVDGLLFENNSFISKSLSNMVLIQPYNSRNIKVVTNKLLGGVQAGRYVTSYETDSSGKHTVLNNKVYCEKSNLVRVDLEAVQTPSVPVCK